MLSRIFHWIRGKLNRGDMMKKDKNGSDCVRLDPEERLCPAFDSTSIKLFRAPEIGEMGMRVLDNFPEEHIQ